MGRIKTVLIKRITQQLVSEHGDKFGKEYEKNKDAVSKLISTKSKKIRNVVAGYVTRLTKSTS